MTPSLGAAACVLIQETLEVVGVEEGCGGAVVAVGVGILGRELVEEALEVVSVEEGGRGAAVAVGVARGGASAAAADDEREVLGREVAAIHDVDPVGGCSAFPAGVGVGCAGLAHDGDERSGRTGRKGPGD